MMEIVYGKRATSPFEVREVHFQIAARERGPTMLVHPAIRWKTLATVESGARLSKCHRCFVKSVVHHLLSFPDTETLVSSNPIRRGILAYISNKYSLTRFFYFSKLATRLIRRVDRKAGIYLNCSFWKSFIFAVSICPGPTRIFAIDK